MISVEQRLNGRVELLAGRRPAAFRAWSRRKSSDSATIVLSATSGPAIDWLEPTARNSNRLPVKANGLVRLRSPASFGQLGGRMSTPTSSVPLLFERLGAALLDLLEHVGELIAEEDRDDRRRGFVRAEAVVVAGGGDDGAQQAADTCARRGSRRRRTRGTARFRAACRPGRAGCPASRCRATS